MLLLLQLNLLLLLLKVHLLLLILQLLSHAAPRRA
jgi:hypothetical protein